MTDRQYLTAEQLAERGPWSKDAIERMRSRGILKKGQHWFQPGGPRSKIIYDWAAVERFIRDEPEPARPSIVRLANGKEVNLNAQEDREVQRLLP